MIGCPAVNRGSRNSKANTTGTISLAPCTTYLTGILTTLHGLEKWAKTDVDDAWSRYWKTYADMAESGLFDILAHPDLIKKFGYHPSGDLSRFYEPAIDAIATSGCADRNQHRWLAQTL